MVAWVDRDTHVERLWALEGTRGIKVITERAALLMSIRLSPVGGMRLRDWLFLH